MGSVLKHVASFVFAFFVAELLLGIGGQNLILSVFHDTPNVATPLRSQTLKADLESGKVVVFGSSELSSKGKLKYMVSDFFEDNNQPLKVVGAGGHQSFIILSELAALHSHKAAEHARIVILLSPGWFSGWYSEGSKVSQFLKFMTNDMMHELYVNEVTNDHFKLLVSDYISANEKEMVGTSKYYELMKNYGKETSGDFFLGKISSFFTDHFSVFAKVSVQELKNNVIESPTIKYDFPELDYQPLFADAKDINLHASTSNPYGIRDDYYHTYVEKKGSYSVGKMRSLANNREYRDFLNLLLFLNHYKIKPLLIMQDLHPSFYHDRKNLEPLLASIKSATSCAGYEYCDLWSHHTDEYENGDLQDVMHLGELGWMKVNKKIIEHFNLH